MSGGDPQGRLAAWPARVAEALDPALAAAADNVATEARRQLEASGTGMDPATIVTRHNGQGRAIVSVTMPNAAALEFGTRRTAARPFLRPAVMTTRNDLGRLVSAGLRRALSRGAR